MLKVVRINIDEGRKTYRDLEYRLVEFLRKIDTVRNKEGPGLRLVCLKRAARGE